MSKSKATFAFLSTLTLMGCSSEGTLTSQGVIVNRSACPAVAIPAATGDITLFSPENSRDADAIDVVANITNVRSTCNDVGDNITSNITFDVQARRRDGSGARDVVLPYFAVVVQGGTNIVSKSVSNVGIHFADGQQRASTSGSASGNINRAALTLPADIQRQVTRERKPGDADAAVDPLANPEVRDAVRRVSFEVLVGFQLTQDQLAYNATR
ncbi:MAG: hypothetical protein JWO25_625 [Alphaproteobacteria bacterium]|nr:hypothetical protein [Alphaproteobacteria bacterium]